MRSKEKHTSTGNHGMKRIQGWSVRVKRDESEAIMGNDDRRGTASFVSESGGKYDIMASQPERESA